MSQINIKTSSLEDLLKEDLKDKIINFQFRDNRSVEHFQPQNPTEGIDWKKSESSPLSISKIKDQFGNLALISVRSNSSYNNQLPHLKKHDFVKRSEKWGIKSLNYYTPIALMTGPSIK
jgi:hypothetical protein